MSIRTDPPCPAALSSYRAQDKIVLTDGLAGDRFIAADPDDLVDLQGGAEDA